ncbi:ATR-interacting protein mus304 [Musca vetustissima]|uniref:ATR-interacting protein mus304 n=1 Tax=Musca vetustissima TaxID=27455 RepID=UPI002AB62478|nr:ATR-interacting protein mus304 [Musca vetustissima]
MAKRFQPMKEFGRNMKKPKLDISINRGSTHHSTVSTTKTTSTSNEVENNFWDDDDDDVILLATQVAEAAAVAKTSNNSNAIISETEITFTEFASAATTSTQMPAATYEIPGPDILSQMFEDDDDDLMAAVEKEDPAPFKKPIAPPRPQKPVATASKPRQTIEKPPSQKPPPTTNTESEDIFEIRLTQSNNLPDTSCASVQSSARRQLASERQIKFLMEKVDALKKENLKISNKLTESKSKIESKEGEVSLLRDELRHMKQQANNLKMEKIFSAEAAKGECQLKIAELAKKVEAQQAEIRLKEAQTSRMKMKQADETQKLQQSMVLLNRTEMPGSKQDKKLKKCLMKMQSLDLNISPELNDEHIELYPPVFDSSLDKGGTVKRKTLFERELENIQTLLAQLQLMAVHEIPKDFITRCIESVCKVFPEFWSYTQTLYFLKYCEVHPYHNYSLSDSKIYPNRLLQQPSEIYERERCLCFRRYIAILAIMCQREASLALALLQHKHGEYYLLQIATDSIVTLGFACGICEHFGVLEAFSVWLKSMLRHISHDTETSYMEMLVDHMKHIVFTRPCAWIFREISICLFESCKLPQILDMLCINSPEATFVADRVKSTYRFSNESCFMQVYCGLLEIVFPLSAGLHLEHFRLLVDICWNHIRFAYHCFIQPPKFIHRMLPIYDDEEEDDDEMMDVNDGTTASRTYGAFETTEQNSTTKSVTNSTSNLKATTTAGTVDSTNINSIISTTQCECYIKLCLSVVTLVFQLMRQWIFHKMEYCTDEVTEISRLSVQLLHMIFCDYYLTCLFRDSEATTKYYLSLILKWWSEHAKKLNFNEIDLKFLQKIQNSHVIPKDIADETNLHTVVADLTEWQTITKDAGHDILLDSLEEAAKIANRLGLIDSASDEEKFFEVFKGYAFNFQ